MVQRKSCAAVKTNAMFIQPHHARRVEPSGVGGGEDPQAPVAGQVDHSLAQPPSAAPGARGAEAVAEDVLGGDIDLAPEALEVGQGRLHRRPIEGVGAHQHLAQPHPVLGLLAAPAIAGQYAAASRIGFLLVIFAVFLVLGNYVTTIVYLRGME